jgi:hypothetical protein
MLQRENGSRQQGDDAYRKCEQCHSKLGHFLLLLIHLTRACRATGQATPRADKAFSTLWHDLRSARLIDSRKPAFDISRWIGQNVSEYLYH